LSKFLKLFLKNLFVILPPFKKGKFLENDKKFDKGIALLYILNLFKIFNPEEL
jgi:hypothetical protein